MLHLEHRVVCPETWTLRIVDKKHLEISELWYRRRMEITWTGRVRNGEVLHTAKEERNNLCAIKRREANWSGHILRRYRLLKDVSEGKKTVTSRRGKRRKQLLQDIK